jgi:hypothetical protein
VELAKHIGTLMGHNSDLTNVKAIAIVFLAGSRLYLFLPKPSPRYMVKQPTYSRPRLCSLGRTLQFTFLTNTYTSNFVRNIAGVQLHPSRILRFLHTKWNHEML